MPFIVMVEPVKARSGTSMRRRIAVVETNLPPGEAPSQIHTGAAGVVRIIETWEDLNVGRTRSSAFYRAREEAEELVRRLTVEAAITLKRQRLATMEKL